ncbi:MAG: 3'(2'),5'-bisphosphate nucleotidase CysQ [Gemmatimonadota bacterium]
MSGEHAADLALAMDAARRAGAAVMRHFGRELDVTYKTPAQPLTAADLEADALLYETLIGARPAYGWLSEETVDTPDRLACSRVWIVDPIDGTRSFIARLPEFTVSVGLAEDGVPIAGVVFNPARDELFHAVRGGGAYVEVQGGRAERLRVSTHPVDDRVTLLTSRTELAAGDLDPFREGWHFEPTGSTAYKLARVAWSRGEAFLSRGPKSEWDICAGVLLVREAGGCVTDMDGADLRFNGADPYVHGIVAAHGALHGVLRQRLAALPPARRLT